MRKFWLRIEEDAGNTILDLQGGFHYWTGSGVNLFIENVARMIYLTGVSGLGFETNCGFEYIGNAYYLPTRNVPGQNVIAGTLNFVPVGSHSPYEAYRLFVDRIEGKRVSLLYSPEGGAYTDTAVSVLGAKTSIIDGVITKITKQELKAGILSVGFEFRAYMPWYNTAAESKGSDVVNNSVITLNKGTSGIGRSFDITLTTKFSVTKPAAIIKTSGGAVLGGFSAPDRSLAQNDVLHWCSDPVRRCFEVNGVDATQYTNLSLRLYPLLTDNATIKFGIAASGEAMTGTFTYGASYKAYSRSV